MTPRASSIAARYRAMKTRQAKDWWTATFGDPASWMVLAIIGDWAWVTPNGISVVSLVIRLLSAVMIAVGQGEVLYGAVFLMQVGLVMDHMDGNLARYRHISSISGGFMDRIFDGVSFLAIMSALGVLAAREGQPAYFQALGSLTGGLYLVICYMYWSYAFYEFKQLGRSRSVAPGAIQAELADVPTWRIMLQGQKRLLHFHHIDYYFWVSLAILLDRPHWGILLLLPVLTYKVAAKFSQRFRGLRRYEAEG